jgi:hypothetical protein
MHTFIGGHMIEQLDVVGRETSLPGNPVANLHL